MTNRPVTFADMIAWCGKWGDAEWWKNRRADGAGTQHGCTHSNQTEQANTTAMRATMPSHGITASVADSPPSAGTTASGAGSVAAAVEALRAAINDDRLLRNGGVPSEYWYAIQRIEVAVRSILALDVPGQLAARMKDEQDAADMVNIERTDRMKAESDAAKLREQLATAQENLALMSANADRAHEALRVEREACDTYRKWHTWYGALCRFVGNAVDHRCDLCKAHDTRRAAEKTTEDETCKKPSSGSTGSVTTFAQSSEQRSSSDSCSQPSAAASSGARAATTTTDPAPVTDEDRKMAEEWNRGSVGYWTTESIAALIARIRHERDGEVRELVDVVAAEKEAHEKTKRDYKEYRRWCTPLGGLDEA